MARSIEKVKFRKSPLSRLVLDLYFCCVGQFGSIGKSTILVFYLAKSKKTALCWPHDLHTWPRCLPCKSHLEKFKFTIFCGQVHFQCKCNRYKPVTFKITCQSSQGHLLSKEVNWLSKTLFLSPWKCQGQSFKCKLTEFVSWDFRYFWFQCKVNGKFGIWSPMSSYMYCKGTQNWIFGPLTYPFVGISNQTIFPQEVICSHMSKVIYHPSWINLYLHLELSWIWLEIFFCICELSFVKEIIWFHTIFFSNILCIHWFTIELSVESVNIQEKFENISASLNFKFIFWFFHPLVFEFETLKFFLVQPSLVWT